MQNQESEQKSFTVSEAQQQVCQNYQAVVDFVDQLPNCLTTLKKQYVLDQATVNKRFVFLCLTTLTAAGLTARSKIFNYAVNPSFIKITRNSILTYLGAGLFIVPEVFNPYLIYRK